MLELSHLAIFQWTDVVQSLLLSDTILLFMKAPGIFILLISCSLGITACKTKLVPKDTVHTEEAFDGELLSTISTETGINFPSGSVGVGYIKLGAAVDQARSAKIRIAPDKVSEFRKNAIFSSGKEAKMQMEFAQEKDWWQLSTLAEREDQSIDLDNGGLVEMSFGIEADKPVAYVSWISI